MMFPKDSTQPDQRRACRYCGKLFMPRSTLHSVCSRACTLRNIAAKEKSERASTRARKEAMKRIPDLIKEAQHAFNAFIRVRDSGKPCICCGSPLGLAAVGGGFDCGHYRSVGSASHLRFHEDNAHGQRKVCNRYGAGRAVDYRIGLIARIGLERVEALEADNKPHKWTADELRAIKAEYRAKLKEIQSKERQQA